MMDYDYNPVIEAMIKHNVPVKDHARCENCTECCVGEHGMWCMKNKFYTTSDYYCGGFDC